LHTLQQKTAESVYRREHVHEVLKMVLNQNLNWENAEEWLRNTFKGQGEHKLLDAGMKIYKFNDREDLFVRDGGKISEFWSPYEAYEWDGGLENRAAVGKAMGNATLKELSRIVVAVCENWNSLDYLVTARLKLPVYCLFGAVAPQVRYEALGKNRQGETVYQPNKRSSDERQGIGGGNKTIGGKLVGSASQLVIPNLTIEHLENIESTKL